MLLDASVNRSGSHRKAAMDAVIDRTDPTSPEELAIHFLLRHAACRMALTGQAAEEALLQALLRAHPGPRPQPAPAPAADAASRVTRNDSCAARFSRAYAAARHRSAPAGTSRRARNAA
jgi:hypothetical protein